jgi:tRNA dimethylallyltransferase
MAKTLIVVLGPTAIGKTAMGIELAKALSTEIISADSRQFFKEMSIGTAVPSKEELGAVKHHFVQHKSIHDAYSVGDFEKDALTKINEIFQEKEHLVVVGGSGLYVKAVTDGLDHFPEVEEGVREQLQEELDNLGIKALQHELSQVDPNYFKLVQKENPHRLIRALEVYRSSGKPFSSFLGKDKEKRNFNCIKLGLEAERSLVYERINQRVDKMMEDGLLEEVLSLLPYQSLNALNTVGYKELFAHLEGHLSLEKAIEEIKKNTRRFAKRQFTWFRNQEKLRWYGHQEKASRILEDIESINAKNN